MAETIPRWGMPEVNFVEINPEQIESAIITGYERVAGRTLAAGDPVRLFLLSVTAQIIQLRHDINFAGQQNLLTYAQGEYLDAFGASLQVTRMPASCAETMIQFTLSQALSQAFVIPAGFAVAAGTVTFETDEELVINSGDRTGSVHASCTEPGTIGNGFVPGQITNIVTPMAYLESATNTSTSVGGGEIEDDSSYAERIKLRPDSFSVAGPDKAYQYYAHSYSSSIIDVVVDSPTAGQVDVYPLLDGGVLPTSGFLEGLLEFLSGETIRPLTDYVLTKSPTAVNYQIQVDYWINKSDANRVDAIQTTVKKAVEAFRVWQQTKIGRDISQDMLIHMVIQAGAAEIDRATLKPTQFQELTVSQVAQCTDVVINFKGYKDD